MIHRVPLKVTPEPSQEWDLGTAEYGIKTYLKSDHKISSNFLVVVVGGGVLFVLFLQ